MIAAGRRAADETARPAARMLLQADAAIPRHSEATAVELVNGGVLLAWCEMDGTGDNAASRMRAMVSSDRGHTWGPRRLLLEHTAGINAIGLALRRLADGTLGLAYSHRDSRTAAGRLFVTSGDEGQTWSAPVRLPQVEPYQTGCPDRMTVLTSGRIVVPVHCSDDWDKHYLHVRVACSDDHGATWSLSDPLALPQVLSGVSGGESGCIEPDVAQRADGTLLMVIRTAMGTLFRAESGDEGSTWTGLRSLEVVSPVAPARITRLPQSDLLFLVWIWSYSAGHRGGGRRRPLACAVSEDGGDTWPRSRRKVLEDDPSATYCYPTCLWLGDEAFVTYLTMPAPEVGGPLQRTRSLKSMHLPLSWITR